MSITLTKKSIHALIAVTIFASCLASCASQPSKYGMDEATSNHPATQRFLAFAESAKTAKSYDDMLEVFYTRQTRRQIPKLLGWPQFVYSSAYTTLKNGDCESIQLKPSGNRVQIDCVGTTIVPSMFLGDQEHRVHLRVFMVNQQGQWFFDKSGYVTASSSGVPVTYGRSGIKFKSALEQ